MKVRISDESRKIITIDQMPAARKVVEVMKEDDWTVKDYAAMAARIASGCNAVNVLEASAEIAANCRAWDEFAEGSGKFDVWVEFTAFADNGFVMGGAYVTDLWMNSDDNLDETRSHMYIRKFAEVK